MRVLRNILQLTLATVLIMAAIFILKPAKAEAAVCSSDYFTGSNYCGGHQVLPSRGGYSIDHAMDDINNADDFINRMRGFVFDGGGDNRAHQGRTGSEFMILSMLGYPAPHPGYDDARTRFGDFENLVRQYDAAGRINWNAWVDYPANFVNSRVSRSYNEAGYYIDPSAQSQWTIIFYNPDGTQIMIKKNCANIVGSTTGALQNLTGKIQGYKVEFGTKAQKPEFAGPLVSAASGTVYQAGGNPYALENLLANRSYTVTAQTPPGWKLVGFYLGGTSFSPGTSYSLTLYPNQVVDLWPAYERQYYPWLQTEQGNVSSLNSVVGQSIGFNGGRNSASASKEAEFVVINAATSGSNFCSSNAYALGSNQYSGGSWKCLLGQYKVDPKYTSINNVINNIKGISGNGCISYPNTGNLSSPSGVPVSVPNLDISNGCSKGMIWKYPAGDATLTGGTFRKGRATILVQGNLHITGNITINSAGPYDGDDIPNLGIAVDGDITIDDSVTRLDAAILATGTIKTCGDNYRAPASPKCVNNLDVNGMLASGNGVRSFEFGRRSTNVGGGTGNPAEYIRYQGKIIGFPPPEFTFTKSKASRVTKYQSNLPPRF